MSSTSTSAFPLATEQPCTTDCGDGAGTANSAGTVNSDAGAGGGSTDNTFALSEGGLIAIIVIVVLVAILGSKSPCPPRTCTSPASMLTTEKKVGTASLFYVAKKREWRVRETLRRSARKVVTALTPRRTEFPSSVRDGPRRSKSGRTRLDDIPPTPRLRPEDVEKGLAAKVNVKKYFSQK